MLTRILLLTALLLQAAATLASAQTLLILNKAEASASILDLSTSTEVAKLPTGEGPHEVAVSPDQRTAVVADYGASDPGNTLTVIDLSTLTVVSTIDLGEHTRPHGIVFLRDGGHVVVTTEGSQHLLVVDVFGGGIARAIPTGGDLGHMVAITPDETRAFVPHMRSNDVAAIDLVTGKRIGLVDLQEEPEGIDVSPDGREVWITNRGSDTISVLDTQTLDVLATLECPGFPIRLKFTREGRYALVSNARGGDVAVFDAKTREVVKRIPMLAESVAEVDERLFGDQFDESPVPVGILIHPEEEIAYVANTNADVVSVIDLETLAVVDRLVGGKEPDGLGFASIEPGVSGDLAHENLMATLWVQRAAEYKALARSVYAGAQNDLEAKIADRSFTALTEQKGLDFADLPPAIILDVDETVLDNVGYQARLIQTGTEYGSASWTAWCNERAATPVPGALEFCRRADELGVAVFYVTNRKANVEHATFENLRDTGFPVTEEHVMARGERAEWTGNKTSRRAHVAATHRVIMMFGDNLGDFFDITGLAVETRNARVAELDDWWGSRWYVLPNPMYGSWDAVLFDEDFSASREERLWRKRAWLD